MLSEQSDSVVESLFEAADTGSGGSGEGKKRKKDSKDSKKKKKTKSSSSSSESSSSSKSEKSKVWRSVFIGRLATHKVQCLTADLAQCQISVN